MVDDPTKPDFMNRLRDSLGREPSAGTGDVRRDELPGPLTVAAEVQKYAPAHVRENRGKNRTRTQTIGEFIVALPYREAMTMGKGIQAKLTKAEGQPTVEELTAAIQSWAWEWETFEDEERPGSADGNLR